MAEDYTAEDHIAEMNIYYFTRRIYILTAFGSVLDRFVCLLCSQPQSPSKIP